MNDETEEICIICEEENSLCECAEEFESTCPTDYYDPDDWGSSWDDALDEYYT